MEYRRFDNTIVARIDRGEEVLEQVAAIAQAEQIKLASVQALGAVGEFTVGVFHTAEKGEVLGGHLNRAVISATCEMVITVIDGRVDRFHSEEIGLNLFQF